MKMFPFDRNLTLHVGLHYHYNKQAVILNAH